MHASQQFIIPSPYYGLLGWAFTASFPFTYISAMEIYGTSVIIPSNQELTRTNSSAEGFVVVVELHCFQNRIAALSRIIVPPQPRRKGRRTRPSMTCTEKCLARPSRGDSSERTLIQHGSTQNGSFILVTMNNDMQNEGLKYDIMARLYVCVYVCMYACMYVCMILEKKEQNESKKQR